jgi:uncharacterized membrane protein
MPQFAGMVLSREPLVDDIIGFMDGVSIPAKCTDERFEQNAFYCGYDCDTMVNNVFAYGPDGKVFFVAVNFPGSWADGALTARILHIIKKNCQNKFCWAVVAALEGFVLVTISDDGDACLDIWCIRLPNTGTG